MSGLAPLATTTLKGPHVDFAALSPLIALLGGAAIVLLVGLLGSRWIRAQLVPALSLLALGAAAGLTIWQWNAEKSIVAGALRIDALSLTLNLILVAGGVCTVLLAWRSLAAREAAHGEWHALLLTSIAGMSLLAAAQNTVALFLGLELLSIPLYVLCATELKREHSLESGLKYLIVGSVGSATLLYGLALIYGATGQTDFTAIAGALSSGSLATDPLTLTGIALCVAGLCFKASVAPFHQWTPDVYEGAPTPVTAFMAVATKVAALGVFLRLFDVALIEAHASWGPAVAALAALTIVVGNVGALGQSSLKRMLAYSSVAQAGYMLAGVVVASRAGRAGDGVLPGGVPVHEHGRVRHDPRPRARDRPRRHGRGDAGAGPRAPAAGLADDARDAGPGRHPGDGGVHGQVLPDRRLRLGRLHVAGSGDRDRLDDLARLLPAGDRGDVDERRPGGRARPGSCDVRTRPGGPRRGRAAGSGGRLAGAGRAGPPQRLACSPRWPSWRSWPAPRSCSSASSPSRCSTSCTGSAARSGCCRGEAVGGPGQAHSGVAASTRRRRRTAAAAATRAFPADLTYPALFL